MNEVTVNELIALLDKDGNKKGATGKERILGINVDGKVSGYVTSVKLDGWGGGLITDVWLYITTEQDGAE